MSQKIRSRRSDSPVTLLRRKHREQHPVVAFTLSERVTTLRPQEQRNRIVPAAAAAMSLALQLRCRALCRQRPVARKDLRAARSGQRIGGCRTASTTKKMPRNHG